MTANRANLRRSVCRHCCHWPRRSFAVRLGLLGAIWVTLCSPVFAQFGGTIKDITAKFEEPMKGGAFVNEIEGIVPKFPAGKNNKSRTALTRWYLHNSESRLA